MAYGNDGSTIFPKDGVNPVQETAGAAVLATTLTGLGIDQFFSRTDPSGSRHLLPDALGSIIALTDSAGTVETEYTYEPFGRTTVTGAASFNPFQYTGREDDGFDMYYYRARYYHPVLQRFISPDPLTCGELSPTVSLTARFESQGIHQYVYSLNSPVLRIDPLGLTSDCSYYTLRCQQQGSFYYCTLAPTICNNIPGFDCVRKCLQDYDAQRCVQTYGRKDVPVECIYSAHEFCFVACAIRGGN